MSGELIAGRYRLLEPLGRGAMSAVWLAEDEELARRVAVKMLAPTADRARFEREARAAAALSHPHIATLYDYGEAEDGRPYMVLEHLPGGSLEDRLAARAQLSDDETARIAGELAAGLAHAHERGLVHRDLKPANVLFDAEGRAKIADFGIARMTGTGTLTEAGTVLGTASYISPEQASGLPAGPASDVYSFGVILFRMLTGSLPFVSTNAMELVRMHRDEPPPSVADVRGDAPPALAAVAAAALAKDPAQRPADGAALVHELGGGDGTATAILPPAAAAETQVLAPPPAARGRRTPALAAVLALLLLGGGAALAVALTRGGGASPAATTGGSISLPVVPTQGTTTATPSTSAPATTAPTTTAPTTTTTPTTTSARTTTTTPTTTTAPTTTAPTTTTTPTTTADTTTDTFPTTTAATIATTTDTTTTTGP